MMLGNAKRIIGQQVMREEHEDIGTWDTRAVHRINRWAGHGGDENAVRLLTVAPHAVPTLAPSNDLVIQKLDRLDVRCNRLIPTDATLFSMPGAPLAIGCLPPSTRFAVPSLSSIAHVSAAQLMIGLADADFIDPTQLDSPASKRRLSALGIDDPTAASPGLLRRCFDWLRGVGSSERDAEAAGEAAPAAQASEDEAAADALQSSIRLTHHDELNLLPPQPSDLAAASIRTLVSPKGPPLPPHVQGAPTPIAAPTVSSAATINSASSINSVNSTAAPVGMADLQNDINQKRVLPPAAPQPPAAPPPPAELVPPPSKRLKSDGESKQKLNARSRANPWYCTCLPVWPSAGGRAWHQAACPRQRYITSGGTYLPTVGERITVLACAGPRAGQIWECTRVHKDGWVRV